MLLKTTDAPFYYDGICRLFVSLSLPRPGAQCLLLLRRGALMAISDKIKAMVALLSGMVHEDSVSGGAEITKGTGQAAWTLRARRRWRGAQYIQCYEQLHRHTQRDATSR